MRSLPRQTSPEANKAPGHARYIRRGKDPSKLKPYKKVLHRRINVEDRSSPLPVSYLIALLIFIFECRRLFDLQAIKVLTYVIVSSILPSFSQTRTHVMSSASNLPQCWKFAQVTPSTLAFQPYAVSQLADVGYLRCPTNIRQEPLRVEEKRPRKSLFDGPESASMNAIIQLAHPILHSAVLPPPEISDVCTTGVQTNSGCLALTIPYRGTPCVFPSFSLLCLQRAVSLALNHLQHVTPPSTDDIPSQTYHPRLFL